MANRENYPASLFPLRGDISAEAGQTLVTVQGIQGVPVTTTAPADGQGLTYVAANGDLEWSSASGTVTNSGTLTSNAVILGNGGTQVIAGAVLPADATKYYDGTGAFSTPAGGGGGSSIPAIASFTWVNQGGSTATQTVANGPILMQIADSGSLNWRGLFVNTPVTPYKVKAQVRGIIPSFVNSQTVGAYFYDGTKLMGLEFLIGSSGVIPRVERITNVNTDSGTQVSLGTQVQAHPLSPFAYPIWVQLRNDGSTLYFDYSIDGVNFINVYSEAVGTFITPTQYGFGGISVTSGGLPNGIGNDLLGWVTANNATL